jgi:glycosyltransferase involved in cell wall biosynthesis
VATDVPGIRDVVGEAAILVPPKDARAVADGLARVANDPAFVGMVRTRGLRQSSKFTWDEIAAQVDRVYARVVLGEQGVEGRNRP